MDSRGTDRSVTGKAKKSDKTRRTWTNREEKVLVQALKEAITKGWKSENGFRAGYLQFLEDALKNVFPNTDLRGNPHINSKIHVWKKLYGSLATMLNRSGVGWNDTENMIEATNESWEVIVKADNGAKMMRYKRWPYYQDRCEIFGNDRATCEHVETFAAAVNDVLNMNSEVPNNLEIGLDDIFCVAEVTGESMSVSHTLTSNSKAINRANAKKRKQISEDNDLIVGAINNLATITNDNMSSIIKEMSADAKISSATDSVLDALGSIPELTSDDKVRVVEMLLDNPNKLALFLRLGHEDRLNLTKRLLNL